MSSIDLQREAVTTPLDWNDDPFGDGVDGSERGQDDLEPVAFMGNSAGTSFPGGDLSDDMIEGNSRLRNDTSRVDGMGGSSNQASSDTADSDIFGQAFSDPGGSNTTLTRKNEGTQKKRPASTGASLTHRRKKKPKGMPKRPLSAYNLYFQSERAKILEAAESGEGGKLGFEGLGKIIGSKWRVLPASERKKYDKLADKDSARYRKEMDEYNQKKHKRMEDSEQLSYENLLRSSGPSPGPPSTLHQGGVAEAISSTGGQQPMVEYLHTGAAPTPSISAAMRDVPPSHRRTEVDGYASPRDPSREQEPRGYEQEYPPPSPNSRRQPKQQVRPPRHQFDAEFGMVVPSRHAEMTPPSQYSPHPEAMLSFPPLPQHGAEQVALPPNHLPVPPGMEIVLPDRNGIDRKYRIQYSCFSMSKQAAHQYVESISGGSRHGAPSSSSAW